MFVVLAATTVAPYHGRVCQAYGTQDEGLDEDSEYIVPPTRHIETLSSSSQVSTLSSRYMQDHRLRPTEGELEIGNSMQRLDADPDHNVMCGSPLLYEQSRDDYQESEMRHPAKSSSLQTLSPIRFLLDGSTEVRSSESELASHYEQGIHINQDCHSIRPPRISSLPHVAKTTAEISTGTSLPKTLVTQPQADPPQPDPEPELPFDFHRFLEQLRHRTADPVAKYLRSFLIEFGRKQWMVHEQVKLVRDFLHFITNKMARCEVWREVSVAEFDNAKEGMEKLVMNRLYTQTFSPAIASPLTSPNTRDGRRHRDSILDLGRRGQHQEDIERDEIFRQKVRIYSWVQEEHLDIPPVSNSGRRFLLLAQQELLKIKTFRAPRDKVICILNCCKVIFGILRNTNTSDTSADSFVPLLIYVVLHANPEHLVSNVQYIMRFRNQDKISGEAGYYLSSLMGAVHFVENLDRTSLTISDEDFEANVEAAVSVIAEKSRGTSAPAVPMRLRRAPPASFLFDKSAPSQPEIVSRHSIEAEYSSPEIPPGSHRRSERAPNDFIDTSAVGGLLRSIGKPLSNIGRIFSDDCDQSASSKSPDHSPRSPQSLTPAVFQPPRLDGEEDGVVPSQKQSQPSSEHVGTQDETTLADETAARQERAETVEAIRIDRAEHDNVIEYVRSLASLQTDRPTDSF